MTDLPAFLDALDVRLRRQLEDGTVLTSIVLAATLANARRDVEHEHPTPALGWSEWLDWAGGPDAKCPLPSDAGVRLEGCPYSMRAELWTWDKICRFRYRTDNPADWVERGDWIPPAALWDERCPVRLEWTMSLEPGAVRRPGTMNLVRSGWDGITHIRLRPREAKAGEACERPNDDTAQALLRQAMKPEEIAGEKQGERVDALISWMVRFGEGHANPKWLAEHAAELAFYAHQQRLASMKERGNG